MRRKNLCLAKLKSVLVLFVLVCGPSLIPAIAFGSSETKTSGLPASVTKERWAIDWENTLKAAKTEGKVVIYTTRGSEARTYITKAFKSKYGLELEFVTGKGDQLAEKLSRERRAGLHLGDVCISGITGFLSILKPEGVIDPIRPILILPEILDEKAWYGNKLPFIDAENMYIFGFGGYVFRPLAINTDLVKEDEMQSYRDLLNPKWANRIVMMDPTIQGAAQSFFTAVGHYIMGYDFLQQLAKQKPLISRDDRLLTEWVARGKYPIVIGAKPDPINEFKKAGAPIRSIIPKEGSFIEPSVGAFVLVNKAPHPNATKVFINWLLTKEGQTVYSQAVGVESAREDVPKGHLDPKLLRKAGTKYIYGAEEFHKISRENIRTGKAKEIFGGRDK